MIVPIGRWVLGEACRQMRDWQARCSVTPPLNVGVNVSGKQLVEAGFVEQVRGSLLATAWTPGTSSWRSPRVPS